MAELLEAAMLACFGVSWPVSAVQAWRARTATGTSPLFLALITAGYVFGIAAKLVGGRITWVLGVYVFNLVALAANWVVYLRNRRLDSRRGR